jgi:hypothetical protein
MHCLPPALFEGRNLAYDATAHAPVNIGGVQMPNPIWSTTFCEWLRRLVVHPFFQGSPALLAVVIQYAVKLRTNDRRWWPLENPTSDVFLDELAMAFRNSHPAQSSREVHTVACTAIKQRGKILPPISALFREMETSIPIAAAVSNISENPFAPYMVTTADVKAVATALDDLHIRGAPAFFPSDFNFSWVRSGLRSNDQPSGAAGVTRAMQKAHRRAVQAEILRARRPPPPQPTPSSSGNAGRTPSAADMQVNLQELVAQLRAENEQLRVRLREAESSGPGHEDLNNPNDYSDNEGYYHNDPTPPPSRAPSEHDDFDVIPLNEVASRSWGEGPIVAPTRRGCLLNFGDHHFVAI